MKRPAFQFYPADWRNNAKLRRCSEAARGAWIDILCLLHDFDEYGVCRWPLADLARAANIPMRLVKELVEKNVLKGGDKDAEPYIYTPRHAGKDGEPVTLVTNNGGPIWYCSRFVRDEYIRQKRGQTTRFDDENNPQKQPPKTQPKVTPKPPFGDGLGDGSTSTSTSSIKPPLKDTLPQVSGEGDARAQPGIVCKAIKDIGIVDVSPSHPLLLKLINAGATQEEFEDAARTCKAKGKKFAYLLGMVEGMRADAANAVVTQGKTPKPNDQTWRFDDVQIMAKARELGVHTPGKTKFEILAAIDKKEGRK